MIKIGKHIDSNITNIQKQKLSPFIDIERVNFAYTNCTVQCTTVVLEIFSKSPILHCGDP